MPEETESPKMQRPLLLPAGAFVVYLQISSMHPHIPHPRRKAARTCEDAAGEVRIAHGEMNAGCEAKCQQEMEVCITVSLGEPVAPANLALASGPELRIANPQRDPFPANRFSQRASSF
jgi:hypothetical protein